MVRGVMSCRSMNIKLLAVFSFLVLGSVSLSALDFAILNKGDIIFQEIFIEIGGVDNDGGPEDEAAPVDTGIDNNYYHNFGLLGLEPGARHNIHIYAPGDFLICSFYLYGIARESYVIENVAIEENSVVYILPEHYRESPESYSGITDPDAVYGAKSFNREDGPSSRRSYWGEDVSSLENQQKLELFNYTSSPIFRVYMEAEGGADFRNTGDLLKGRVLQAQESRTLAFSVRAGDGSRLRLLGADDAVFIKVIEMPLKADFLVIYDTDRLYSLPERILSFKNSTARDFVEIIVVDQESSKRMELLKGQSLLAGEERKILFKGDFRICDIIARDPEMKKLYLFDRDLSTDCTVEFGEY